jgi:hypothetical protein
MHGIPASAAARSGFGASVAALRSTLAGLLLAGIVAGCGLVGRPGPTPQAIPAPTCGGAKILIPGALPCDELVRIAIEVLRGEAPIQLDRGIIAVDVELQGCPKQEVPPQIDCAGEDFVQLVTVTFGPSVDGGPIEPSLSVALAPVSGRLLGIVNPLIR